MQETTSGLRLEVDRGPDWIFVRVGESVVSWDEAPPLAEAVWHILEQNFVYRVVLELEQIQLLRSVLIAQLVQLAKRVHGHDGMVRICGLSPQNQDVLHACRLDSLFPPYADRGEAIMASRPQQPR